MTSAIRVLAVLAACGFAAVGASAQTPLGSAFTYQGELNASGQPVTGPVDLRFKLFTAATGGAQVGITLDRPASTVSGGRFSQELDFGAVAFGADARWLEIDVRSPAGTGNYVTLAPRQRITPVPAASFASRPWVTNGTIISYTGGNVGVGTASPSAKLSILGDWDGTEGALRIIGDKPTIGFTGGPLSANTKWITHLGTGGILTFARNLSPTTFSHVLNLTANDRVGIGTTNPASTLDVAGTITIAPATRWKSIHGSAFTPAFLNNPVVGTVGGLEVVDTFGTSNSGTVGWEWDQGGPAFYFAPLDLPDGATILDVCLDARDSMPAQDLAVSIGRTAITGAVTELATTFTAGSPGGIQHPCHGGPINVIVNNANNVYFLRARMAASGNTAGWHYLLAVRVKYSVTEPLP